MNFLTKLLQESNKIYSENKMHTDTHIYKKWWHRTKTKIQKFITCRNSDDIILNMWIEIIVKIVKKEIHFDHTRHRTNYLVTKKVVF